MTHPTLNIKVAHLKRLLKAGLRALRQFHDDNEVPVPLAMVITLGALLPKDDPAREALDKAMGIKP